MRSVRSNIHAISMKKKKVFIRYKTQNSYVVMTLSMLKSNTNVAVPSSAQNFIRSGTITGLMTPELCLNFLYKMGCVVYMRGVLIK